MYVLWSVLLPIPRLVGGTKSSLVSGITMGMSPGWKSGQQARSQLRKRSTRGAAHMQYPCLGLSSQNRVHQEGSQSPLPPADFISSGSILIIILSNHGDCPHEDEEPKVLTSP